ncbi:hypothetical protein BZX65_23460 [Salmonella enterica subsp. enterica serovar Enteritidis]|nr:hypothetical protein [Salmonella enterica subsp. enterica serovar Enteritidis]
MAMKKFSELVSSVNTRIASRDNPTGLKASDLGAYSTAEFDTEMEKYIDIGVTDIEQVGDQSYFPLAIEGSADGAISLNDRYRRYGVCRESDGTIVLLRSATNSVKKGVYYVICKTDQNGQITEVIPTSRRYEPATLDRIPTAIYCHQNGIMLGQAAFEDGSSPKMFIALTDGTFDASKHVAMYLDGSLANFVDTSPNVCCWEINGKIYIAIAGANSYKLYLNVYTVTKSSIGPSGGSVAATQLTNISGRTIEGTAISNSAEMIVCNRITTNDFPSDGIGQIVWRAQIRLLAATKGTKARILIASSWWTNNRKNQQKNGLHQFYLDFETTNNSYSMNPGAGQSTYTSTSSGIDWVGPSNTTEGTSAYNDGFWQWGSGNGTGNIEINERGQVALIQNDNLSAPQARSYTINGFSGNVFDELAKLGPTGGRHYDSNWKSVGDRVVGALASHGYLGFFAKNKVFVNSRTAGGQGNFEARLVTYDWNLSYRYRGEGIDVYGFPPSNNVVVSAGQLSRPFLTVHLSDDNTVVSGSYLTDSNLSGKIGYDATKLAPSGEDISITAANLQAGGQLVWNAYTGTKVSGVSQWQHALAVPPDGTNAPCILFVAGCNNSTRVHGRIAAEVTVSARKGAITVTGVTKLLGYVEEADTTTIGSQYAAWGALAYKKVSDGWLVAGHVPYSRQSAGNQNTYQFRAGRQNDGNWTTIAFEGMYAYLQTSGWRWNVHPVWGIGYVDTAVSTVMGNGGQVFSAVGNSVAEYKALAVKNRYMVSTVVAASGYDIYINEDITCLFAGKVMTLPKGHYNLKDYNSSPGNKTWYVSVVPNGDQLELELTIYKQEDDKGQRVNIGTITTSDTQISVINLNKTTKLGTVTL